MVGLLVVRPAVGLVVGLAVPAVPAPPSVTAQVTQQPLPSLPGQCSSPTTANGVGLVQHGNGVGIEVGDEVGDVVGDVVGDEVVDEACADVCSPHTVQHVGVHLSLPGKSDHFESVQQGYGSLFPEFCSSKSGWVSRRGSSSCGGSGSGLSPQYPLHPRLS